LPSNFRSSRRVEERGPNDQIAQAVGGPKKEMASRFTDGSKNQSSVFIAERRRLQNPLGVLFSSP